MTAEPSPRPWRLDYTPDDCVNVRNADGDIVARVLSEADAALIVDAVNLHEYLIEHNKLNAEKVCELFEERDRLRSELDALQTSLSDKARNYEDVIAYHMRTEEKLRAALEEICNRVSVALNCPRQGRGTRVEIEGLVHDLLKIKECARAAVGEVEK